MRDVQQPGRSPVLGTAAMAATSHPLATVAALDVLRRGGTAVDAAVCAAGVLAVAEPHMTGIGGDCFCLYAPPGAERPLAYNGSGRAPAGADPERLGERIDPHSPHAVTVPGAVEAWARLVADHGRMGLDELLAPAVALARDGCPVQALVASDWAATAPVLERDEHAARVLLPGGRPPAAGERVRQPALARTLERIGRDGAGALYRGEAAEAIAARLRELGGAHSAEDLAAHRGEYVEPVAIDYRGVEVWEHPPNGQGIVALAMLGLLRGLEHAGLEPLGAERLHLLCEAGRIAFAARDAVLADPASAPVPVAEILSERWLAQRRAAIERERALAEVPPPGPFPAHRDTVCLATVDADGGACSFINSLFHPWGSGILEPSTGVLLHNRGAGFTLEQGHPNRLAPGRRPLHTLMPGMAFREGRVLMPFGVMGADYQPYGHVALVQNLVDFELDLQAAIDLPRAMHAFGVLMCEDGVPEPARAGLAQRGHAVVPSGAPLGGAQAIWIDRERGVLAGGSDGRKDGFAAGW